MVSRFAIDLKDLGALDSSSRLPLYAQLADVLAARIRAAQAELAGKALPSEIDVAAHLKISRPTVRQAMSQLLSEGLIFRGRGQGTFVAPPHASRDLGRVVEFDVLPPLHKFEYRLMERERVTPPPFVAKLFKLKPREQVERVRRLRLAGKEMFAFEERFLPLRCAAKITDAMLKRDAGVVFARRLIQGENGRVEFRVRATGADAKIARLLKMKQGAPLLSSEHTYFSSDGGVVLYGIVWFRGDLYDFSFQAPVHGATGRHRQTLGARSHNTDGSAEGRRRRT
jgi:GntR family transcriptional regulator